MNYLSSTPFNVAMGGTEEYRKNYDAIDWAGAKSPPEASALSSSLTDGVPESVTIQSQLREFHQTYGHPVNTMPKTPAEDRVKLRLNLIAEEFFELLAACEIWPAFHYREQIAGEREDREVDAATIIRDCIDYGFVDRRVVSLVEVADALGDLAYVIEGANLEFGIPSEKVLAEIHRSNMSKLGADGKPIYSETGKVLKGPNYSPPNLENVLWPG